MADVLVECRELIKKYNSLSAIDNVDLKIFKGETLGLAGESGSGKSTLARLILSLIKPTSGKVCYKGMETNKYGKELRKVAQIVFQDPQTALNPRMLIKEIIFEPLLVHGISSNKEEKVNQLLELVNLPITYANRFPHELSGGERQRIGIARALALNPEFIIFDEPISSLDVTMQVELLKLISELKKRLKLTCLFIAHDLMVLKYISDRIAIMYRGKIVEIADKRQIFNSPKHEYTAKLLKAIPQIFK